MDATDENPDLTLFKDKVGQRLRSARERAGLDITDIAARTRIPLRHLTAIEQSDYSQLPSPTYSVGFVKSYARVLGLDDVEFGRDVREELGARTPGSAMVQNYEPADPKRVAPKWFAWAFAVLALLVVGGYLLWRHNAAADALPQTIDQPIVANGAVDTAPTVDTNGAATMTSADVSGNTAATGQAIGNVASAAAPNAAGPVVITASNTVWMRIYDADDKVLHEGEMKKGESYTVPADAKDPQIRTGAAELLSVTVGGKPVPPLGKPQRTIKDVGVSASALLARKDASASNTSPVSTTR
jgi:cytoskeletal protein RodZ